MVNDGKGKKLLLNPIKGGYRYNFNFDKAYCKQKIKIIIKVDNESQETKINSFPYSPLLRSKDATRLSKEYLYDYTWCNLLCRLIDFEYCRRIVGYFRNFSDCFQFPNPPDPDNIKERIMIQASLILNLYENNKIESSILDFISEQLREIDSKLILEIEIAAKNEYNWLIKTPEIDAKSPKNDLRIKTDQNKEEIERYFYQFCGKNSLGEMFLTKDDVDHFLAANFVGFNPKRKIKLLKPELELGSIRYFIYEFYKVIDLNHTSGKQKKYCKLLIENFEQFIDTNENELSKRLSNKPPGLYPFPKKL